MYARSDESRFRAVEALQQYWIENRQRFISQVEVIERATFSALSGRLRHEERISAQREAHRLKGSLGTFGLAAASQAAGKIEQAFSVDTVSIADIGTTSALIESLRSAVESHHHGQLGGESEYATARHHGLPGALTTVATADGSLVESLRSSLFDICELHRVNDLDQSIESAYLVVDLDTLPGLSDSHVVAQLESFTQSQHVSIIASALPLERRVALSATGIDQIYSRDRSDGPLASRVASRIREILVPVNSVLAVDDDESMLALLETLLSPVVRSFHQLAEPTEFWQRLESTSPDVVLLDFDMPDIDGIDILRSIRTDERFSGTAVVIVTASEDPAVVQSVFSAGAEECIHKSTIGPDLAKRVIAIKKDMRRLVTSRSGNVPGAPRDNDSEGTVSKPTIVTDIMIVDDDVIVSQLLSESLQTQGYSTSWVKDGLEAIESLFAPATPVPRLVLLDVDMPGLNGLDVLRRCGDAGVLGKTKVVMLTGRSTESETLEALRLGASDHVAKPFSLPVLIEKVRVLLGSG